VDESPSTDVVGTAAYLPPEAFAKAPAGPGFDLWALAVVLLEAFSGTNPFADRDRAATRGRVLHLDLTDLFERIRGEAPALAAFFDRALTRDPAARWQSALQMRDALRALDRSGD
jgi:serine/threonine-protein kinase